MLVNMCNTVIVAEKLTRVFINRIADITYYFILLLPICISYYYYYYYYYY